MTIKGIGKLVGYIAMVKIGKEWDVLAFGQSDEPEPHMLARRDRATVFASHHDCAEAINITYSVACAERYPWAEKAEWKIIPLDGSPTPWIGSDSDVDSGKEIE